VGPRVRSQSETRQPRTRDCIQPPAGRKDRAPSWF